MVDDPKKIGKYDIEGVIGEGGMGVVYKGRDPLIDRVVAIKTIRTDDKSDQDELLKRLQMEAKSAGKLAHPNIVVIHDFGEQEDLTYLVMEYVEGRNLASIIKSGRQIPFATKIDIIIQLCQGLEYAHGLGVTHRDIKPGNIAITARGTAKILDFGLARVDSTRLTKTGFTSGTIAYMSPERMRGDSGTSDDVFALGAVAYEILTYQRAFPGKTYSDVVTKVLSDQFPKPLSRVADLPEELDPIILKAMARDIGNRYQSPGELGKELESFRSSLAYQNFAAKVVEEDSFLLQDDAPVSSTANPYSAGAVTPAPSDLGFDTRQAEGSAPPEDAMMQTDVSEVRKEAAGQAIDRTQVRPAERAADSESAIPTEAMSAFKPKGKDDFGDEKTEMSPRPSAPSAEADEKTIARPAQPEELPKEEDPESSSIKTSVMQSFKKLIKRDIDPEKEKATVIEAKPKLERQRTTEAPPPAAAADKTEATKQAKPLRTPAAPREGVPQEGPTTGRTRQYSPGAKPRPTAPGEPAKPEPGGPAPAAAPAAPAKAAEERVRRGGIAGIWLPSGVLLACILVATFFAHVVAMPAYIVVYAAAILVWIWLLRRATLFTLKQALTIGLLLRVALLFIAPAVASESFRGIWDGRMIANGLNPYAVAPASEEVQFDRPAWFSQLASPDEPSTTPHWALLMFMIVAWIGGGMFFFKLILLGIEVLTIRLLAKEKSGHAMMLYATCPFVVLEGIWHGRIEVIVIWFLVAASWAARQRRDITGGIFTGVGLGSSFFALPALPALLGTAEKLIKTLAVAAVAFVVPVVIFTTNGRIVERLRELIFGPELSGLMLVWLTDRVEKARLAESIAANAEQIKWEPLANAFRSVNAFDMAAAMVGLVFLGILILVTKRSSGPDAAVANCLGVFFLLTAILTPAGWILLIPFAIAARQPFWILYALASPLFYLLPEKGISWMLLATFYLLPPILYMLFRGDDGGVHLFDSAAGPPMEEPLHQGWDPPKRKALY